MYSYKSLQTLFVSELTFENSLKILFLYDSKCQLAKNGLKVAKAGTFAYQRNGFIRKSKFHRLNFITDTDK